MHLCESSAAKFQGGDEDYPSSLVRINDGRVSHDTIPKDVFALQLERDPFQSTVSKSDDVSPEEVIRTGIIQWIK